MRLYFSSVHPVGTAFRPPDPSTWGTMPEGMAPDSTGAVVEGVLRDGLLILVLWRLTLRRAP